MTSEPKAPELSYPKHFLHDIEAMTPQRQEARAEELVHWAKRYAAGHANPKWVLYHMFELARLYELRADASQAMVAAAYEAATRVAQARVEDQSLRNGRDREANEIATILRALTTADASAALTERERMAAERALEGIWQCDGCGYVTRHEPDEDLERWKKNLGVRACCPERKMLPADQLRLEALKREKPE